MKSPMTFRPNAGVSFLSWDWAPWSWWLHQSLLGNGAVRSTAPSLTINYSGWETVLQFNWYKKIWTLLNSLFPNIMSSICHALFEECAIREMWGKLQWSSDSGDSCSRKCKRHDRIRLSVLYSRASQESGFSRPEDVFTFNYFIDVNCVLSLRFTDIML
jgi:hypothetical protein